MIDNRTMSVGGPIALINGMDNFAAKLLAVNLLGKDIRVIGIGGGAKIEARGDFEVKERLEEVKERVNYVFDFVGNEHVWDKAGSDEAKLAVIRVNNLDGENYWQKLWKRDGDWRLIEIIDAFGPGMERGGWLADVFEEAVRNQNLGVPALNLEVRLVPGEEAVEAILRGTLMSGTAQGRFMVAGVAIQVNQLVDVLFYGAKMTKKKTWERMEVYKEWNSQAVEENWGKLRWKPSGEIKETINKTLQYFFTLVDEETRNKKISPKKETVNPAKKWGGWEVEIEDTKKDYQYTVAEESPEPLMVAEVEEEKLENEKIRELEEERGKLENEKNRKLEEEKRIQEEVERRLRKEKELENEKIRKLENEKGKEELEEVEEEDVIVGKNFKIKSGFSLPKEEEIFNPIVKKEVEEASQKIVVPERSRLKTVKKKFRLPFSLSWMVIGISLGCLGLMTVPAYQIWKAIQIIGRAENFVKLVEAKKYDEAGKKTETDLKEVKVMEENIDDMGLKSIGWVRNYYSGLKVIEGVLSLENKGLGLIKSGEALNEGVFGDKDIDWTKELKTLGENLDTFEAEAGVLQARLGGDWSWLPGKWRNYPNKGAEELSKARNMAATTRKSLEFVPEMIGVGNKRKEYLVLLQNEMELRPGGGFIGSYAIMSFDDGKLTDFNISDVYEADGQLKGHVEPPLEIKNNLGEASWYMRDANWQASFTAASKDIQWFFEKETGRKVDGVIGVDLAVARDLIGVVGEVYVPDFKEKITKDNLYEQAEFYSENKSFPGSQQKENFLGGLGKQLFEEVKSMKPMKRLQMTQAIMDLLERNEIQMAINDTNVAQKVATLGWDGSLYEGRCGGNNCYTDYFYAAEANLGVNKANYFLYRNMDMMVDIQNNAISRVVKLAYENTAKSTNWPGGDYKNYLRIYLPGDANLAEVVVYNPDDPSTRKVYNNSELLIKQVGNKKEIGFLVTVPVAKKRTVELRYGNGVDIANKDKFSYLSYIQRQPGYGTTGWVSLVSYPQGWQPNQVEPAASLVGGKLLFNQNFDRDITMGVEISK